MVFFFFLSEHRINTNCVSILSPSYLTGKRKSKLNIVPNPQIALIRKLTANLLKSSTI